MTEGLLAVLGIAAVAALVRQYRHRRAEGGSVSGSLNHAFFSLMPAPMAALVRKEVSFLRVFALVLARRTEGARPGDLPVGHGRMHRKILLGIAFLLCATGMTLLLVESSGHVWIMLGLILLYAAVLASAVGLASKVRPHVLRADRLLVRWGLHQQLAVPLGSIRSVDAKRSPPRRRRADRASDRFHVPALGREVVALRLCEAIEVPTTLGRRRLTHSIVLPVDEAGTAVVDIAARLDAVSRQAAPLVAPVGPHAA